MGSPEPMKVAGDLLRHSFCTPSKKRGLWNYNGSYYQWYGNQWRIRDDVWLEDMLWTLLEDAHCRVTTPQGEQVLRFQPNKQKVENVSRAIAAKTKIPHSGVPVWLGHDAPFPAERGIGFEDVVVDPKTGSVVTRTEDWFDPVTLPVAYDPEATCPLWLQSVSEWGNGDVQWGDLLQRWMGYCLMSHRKYAKWLLMYGKVRSGKGTIARVLQSLIGRDCYMGTSLDDLAGDFGLDGLEQSKVLCISEVSELDGKQGERATRVLKNILGQDPITVNIKFKRQIRNVMVNAAPIVQANEIPMLPNKGRGLSSKMLVLPFDVSFEGRENPHLIDGLLEELPGIASWCAEGARKIEQEMDPLKRFSMPDRASDAIRLYHIQNNPFDHFLEERFVRSPGGFVSTEMVWYQWQDWLRVNEIRNVRVARNQIAMKIEAQSSWGVYRSRPTADSKRGLSGLSLRKRFEEIS
jgi:putative DNA primase/helicase